MRRLPAFATLVSLALAPAVHAAAVSPPGVNLRWDQCYGDGGVQYKNFACDTNTGSERLVGSFELDSVIPGVTSLEGYVSLGSTTTSLPAWWAFNAPGGVTGCRGTALSVSLVAPAAAANCADWAAGQAAGGLAAYIFRFPDPNRALIKLGAGLSAPLDLGPGQEYFAFSIVLSHSRTVGTGACAGCLEPMCVILSDIVIYPGQGPTVHLSNGANYAGSRFVSWQEGYPLDIVHRCTSTLLGMFCYNPYSTFDCVIYDVTRPRGSTWGEVKALYR